MRTANPSATPMCRAGMDGRAIALKISQPRVSLGVVDRRCLEVATRPDASALVVGVCVAHSVRVIGALAHVDRVGSIALQNVELPVRRNVLARGRAAVLVSRNVPFPGDLRLGRHRWPEVSQRLVRYRGKQHRRQVPAGHQPNQDQLPMASYSRDVSWQNIAPLPLSIVRNRFGHRPVQAPELALRSIAR